MCSAQLVVLLCCNAQEGRPYRRADRTVTSEPCAAAGGPRPLSRPLLEHGRAHHTVGWLSCAQIVRLRFQNESKQLNLTSKVTFQCKLIAIFHGKIWKLLKTCPRNKCSAWALNRTIEIGVSPAGGRWSYEKGQHCSLAFLRGPKSRLLN